MLHSSLNLVKLLGFVADLLGRLITALVNSNDNDGLMIWLAVNNSVNSLVKSAFPGSQRGLPLNVIKHKSVDNIA